MAAAFNAAIVAPAPASAMRSAGRIRTSASRHRSSITPGVTDAAPPIRPLPPPRGITGTRCALASRTASCTSAVLWGLTTHRGRADSAPAGSRDGCMASHASRVSDASSVRMRDGPSDAVRAFSISDFDMGGSFPHVKTTAAGGRERGILATRPHSVQTSAASFGPPHARLWNVPAMRIVFRFIQTTFRQGFDRQEGD